MSLELNMYQQFIIIKVYRFNRTLQISINKNEKLLVE
jgi:hypothetical protein